MPALNVDFLHWNKCKTLGIGYLQQLSCDSLRVVMRLELSESHPAN